MKAVKVTYTVQPEYAEQNKNNIQRVMSALRANPIPGMQYSTFILDDGQTFVHINMSKDQETLSKLMLQQYKPDLIIEVSRKVCGTMDFHKTPEILALGRAAYHKAVANSSIF